MPKELEQETPFPTGIETHKVFDELIKPEDTLMIAGPSQSLMWDPYLFYFAAKYPGKLLVLDPQYGKADDHNEQEKRG